MNVDYELIALDLDGTLTNSNKEISDNTRKALIGLMKRGKKVVLVSGRPIYGVMPLAKELKLDQYDGYILGFNGGRVVRCKTGQRLHDYTLPEHVIEPIYKMVKEYPGVCLITYNKDTILAGMKPNQYVAYEAFGNRMPVLETEHFLKDTAFPLNKLVACGEPEQISDIMEKLRGQFESVLNVFTSDPFFGEIMPMGIDKGYSLKCLVEKLGLSPEQVVCCGDSGNDIPMIRYAGMGVAMGNALPEVKEIADYVTLTNDEEGVFDVIKKFFPD